jgi:FG-GAP repeat
MRRLLVVIVLVAGSIVLLPGSRAFGAASRADFNGDGVGDLAIGVPDEDVGAIDNAGAVNVLYGSATGLSAAGDQFWTQDSTGVPGDAETGDLFGSSLANGDFDNDGFSDLAIGVFGEDVGAIGEAGAVNVLYGSATGLSAAGAQLWTQDSTGVQDLAEDGDEFGASLAAGDLNGDGYVDLAIGVPREDVGGGPAPDAGAVNILYGSLTGLTSTGDQFWTQDSTGVEGTAEINEQFGWSLAAANLGRSTKADLAIGVPFESLGVIGGAGAVNVLYGAAVGLTSIDDQFWTQNSAGVNGTAEEGDNLGWSLAAANLGRSSLADLAIGSPFEDVGAIDAAGAVNVLYGSSTGLSASGDQIWTQNTTGVNDIAEAGDWLGWSISAANLGNSSQADLAIGVPFEAVGAIDEAGAVNVLYGSTTGLLSTGDQFWTQDSTGVNGDAEDHDLLGLNLVASNFGMSTQADLAIGVVGESVGGDDNAGAVNVLYGSSTGLTSTDNQLWTQDSTGVEGDGAEVGDLSSGALPGSRFINL